VGVDKDTQVSLSFEVEKPP